MVVVTGSKKTSASAFEIEHGNLVGNQLFHPLEETESQVPHVLRLIYVKNYIVYLPPFRLRDHNASAL